MKKIVLITALFFAMPAFAQETMPPECRILQKHEPSAGVNYQAGVDVYGNPVVPADIHAAPMGMGAQTIVIPLSIDMAQRLQGQNIAGLDMTSTIGFIEVAPDGRVTYNGQDLTGQVHLLCDGNLPETAVPANGQTARDVVKSAPVSSEGKVK